MTILQYFHLNVLIFVRYYWIKSSEDLQCIIRDGPLEKWWGGGGGGGGEFSGCTNFFFCSPLVQEFFFRWNPLHEFFFQANIAFFSVKSRFVIYFALNKLFFTHSRSKDTGHFLIMCARSFRKCTERGGRSPERTASLWIFGVPALWNSSVIKMGWRTPIQA